MAPLEFRTPALGRLYADWEGRRNGRPFPARSDFDIVDFKYIIGQLSLIDVTYDPLRFTFRLHGSGVTRRVGYDMTGKDIEDLPPPAIRTMVRGHFIEVVEHGRPVVQIRERHGTDDRVVESEVLALPLARDGATIDMLLVAIAFLA
jgi:hypothetical protein